MKVNGSVSHDRGEETPEAKARWFHSLPMSERMEMLCAFTDLALTAKPDLIKSAKMLNRLQDVFRSFQQHELK